MIACPFRRRTRGFTLIELLVVIAIIAVLIALLLPAIQKVREAANKTKCQNNLKQISLAIVQYAGTYQYFPHYSDPSTTYLPGFSPFGNNGGWMVLILPFIEQQNLYALIEAIPGQVILNTPPIGGANTYKGTVITTYQCPSDPRGDHYVSNGAATTSYPAIPGYSMYCGNSRATTWQQGPMSPFALVTPVQVTDGTSTTLLLGERPPYKSLGYWTQPHIHVYQGSAETDKAETKDANGNPCPPPPNYFAPPPPGGVNNPCSVNQLWSPHDGGGHFAFTDGSVHFLSYNIGLVLLDLSTSSNGEVIDEGTF